MPLRIAVGVHRRMNFRFSPPTAAVLTRIMAAAGVSTVVEPERVISGATKSRAYGVQPGASTSSDTTFTASPSGVLTRNPVARIV